MTTSPSPWLDVFPELSGGRTSGPGSLSELLRRIDEVPSDLPAPRPDRSGAGGEPAGADAVLGRPDAPRDGVFAAAAAAAVAGEVAVFAARAAADPLLAQPELVVDRARAVVEQLAADQMTRVLLQLMSDASASGHLRGPTPEARYDDFVTGLGTPAGTRRVTEAHPDLLPRVRALAALRLDALGGQLAQTAEQWPAVCEALDLDPADRVLDVRPSGDSHGGGRSVLVLTTSGGRRVVMKPRPVALEEGYGAFSSWLGRRVGLDLPQPSFHRTRDAGWMQHLALDGGRPHPDYHRMVGVHLAALHLLRGTDVHYENILADAQGRPAVVDAEALFVPTPVGVDRPADRLLGVEATGMLSLPFGGDDFDFGALDYRSGARSPFRAWHVELAGRDDMRLEMRSVVVDHPEAVPTGAGRTTDDAAAVATTFEAVLGLVRDDPRHVVERVDSDFPAGRTRYIHRPTMTYALLLRMATHPRFSSDVARQRVFGRLAVLAPTTGAELVASEVRQLTAGEIPAFGVDLHDTRVLDARGRDTGLRTEVTPAEGVRAGIAAVDDEHVALQTTNLRAALAHWTAAPPRPPAPAASPTGSPSAPDHHEGGHDR